MNWRDCSTQMDLPLYSKTKSYEDGYAKGIKWDGNWMPGGPWVYRASNIRNAKHVEMQQQSEFEYGEWHRGFKDGLAIRCAAFPEFAEWFQNNSGKGGYKKFPKQTVRVYTVGDAFYFYQKEDNSAFRVESGETPKFWADIKQNHQVPWVGF